jgi:hypothetical protein
MKRRGSEDYETDSGSRQTKTGILAHESDPVTDSCFNGLNPSLQDVEDTALTSLVTPLVPDIEVTVHQRIALSFLPDSQAEFRHSSLVDSGAGRAVRPDIVATGSTSTFAR